MEWQLADAKNKFSEVVRRALTEGPQRVSRRNESVVVISSTEYDKLTGSKPGFIDYLMSGPPFDDLDLERDQSPMRDANL